MNELRKNEDDLKQVLTNFGLGNVLDIHATTYERSVFDIFYIKLRIKDPCDIGDLDRVKDLMKIWFNRTQFSSYISIEDKKLTLVFSY